MHALAVRVLEHENTLITASDLCGELDSLVALALGAQKYRFNRPQMTTANVVRIEAGRHPLQELTVPVYIANDCFVTGGTGNEEHNYLELESPVSAIQESIESPSMLIMTGPELLGKECISEAERSHCVYGTHRELCAC